MTHEQRAALLEAAQRQEPWVGSKVPQLIADCDRQAAEIERLRGALEQVASFDHVPGCDRFLPIYECDCRDVDQAYIARAALKGGE
jgi:hypothetical protein